MGTDEGRRIEKKVWTWQSGDWVLTDTHRFVWSGWLMLLELEDGGAGLEPVRKYTWGLDLAGQNGVLNSLESAGGIGGLLGVYDADEADHYVYLYDANGNVGQVVNLDAATASAALVATYQYDPYGAVVTQSGDYAAANPFRFSTKYWDDETGLGYWGYRYYDPRTGRWLSRDPIEEEGGLLLCGYVANNPTNATDALGERFEVFAPSIDLLGPVWVGYCGQAYFEINWVIPEPYRAVTTFGWIYQFITMTYDITDCQGNPVIVPNVPTSPFTYYEAWYFVNGTLTRSVPHDTFGFSGTGCCSRGYFQIIGIAKGVTGYSRPGSYRPQPGHPAGLLPCGPNAAPMWYKLDGGTPHVLRIEWDCCTSGTTQLSHVLTLP